MPAARRMRHRRRMRAARYQRLMQFHHALRKLETCGKPVAAAINGLALGGGLEVTLACHYRVVADNPKSQLGLPEAKVGLLPGGGGTQRLPRLIGAMAAAPLLLQGQSLDPKKALGMKLVHAVVPAGDVVAAAKKWIKETPDPVQPWDKKDFKIPGGGPYSPGGGQVFTMGNAMLRKETYGNYPAQRYILSCVYEGLQVPIDAGLRIEARYFTKLLMDPASRNMIRSLFLSMQELGKGARRPKDEKPTDVKTLGVLGAGMMGAGIAYVSAAAGIEVVLLDATVEKANAGRDHVAGIIDKLIEKGRSTPEKKAEILIRVKTTTEFADLKAIDLLIEAVFEDRAVKADVTKKACEFMPKTAVFGSNTSTLPITGLAEASDRPESFIGVHFFSPVDRMGLVEIIMGKKTNPHALAVAIDYVQKIKKTPIVVNDFRGFYTSRCVGTFPGEGMAMLTEGIHPAMIENIGRMCRHAHGPARAHGFDRHRHGPQGGASDEERSGHQRHDTAGGVLRVDRREGEPSGPQDRQGLLRLRCEGQAHAPLARSSLLQEGMEYGCECGRAESSASSPSRRWKPRAASRKA